MASIQKEMHVGMSVPGLHRPPEACSQPRVKNPPWKNRCVFRLEMTLKPFISLENRRSFQGHKTWQRHGWGSTLDSPTCPSSPHPHCPQRKPESPPNTTRDLSGQERVRPRDAQPAGYWPGSWPNSGGPSVLLLPSPAARQQPAGCCAPR